MGKRKRTRISDEEALKHYIPGEEPVSFSGPGTDLDLPVHVKELLAESLESKPVFTKPVLAIDRTMTNRKSAVINTEKRRTK